MVALGALAGALQFVTGRWIGSITPAKATDMQVDVDHLRRVGKILIVMSPVTFALLAGVGLSGMLD